MLEIPRGSLMDASYTAIGKERFAELLALVAPLVDLVVIVAPPLAESADAQAICSAVGETIIVVEASVTRTADVVTSLRLLAQVDAHALGAVVVEKRSLARPRPATARNGLAQPRSRSMVDSR